MKKQSVAYRAVILAVLMVSSVAVMGVGAASGSPVSMVAEDWEPLPQTGQATITDNATNGGIDVDFGEMTFMSMEIVETTAASSGQVTLYYEATVEGQSTGITLFAGGTQYAIASNGQSSSGSITTNVSAGSTIQAQAIAMTPGSTAVLTLSTVPLDGPTNSPPVADLSAPATAVQNQPITLDASGSSDPDGDALTFAWDLDGDGAFDDATGATVQHSFADPGMQTVSVEVSDGTDTNSTAATVEVAYAAPLDVKPGSDDNPVNAKSKGVLTVAILNTDDFDPTAVVIESLTLSVAEDEDGASPVRGGHFEDVDGDGDTDLVVHFATADLGLESTSSTLYLSGEMADGISLVGSDDVTVVGNDKSNNGNGRGR